MNLINLGNCLGILSIILGIFAIYQSCRYNRASKKLNDDTKKVIDDFTRRQDEIFSVLREVSYITHNIKDNKSMIRLTKDELIVRKTSLFKEENVNIIIAKINGLFPFIKPKCIESIKFFLNLSEDKEKLITLRRILDKKDVDKLNEIKRELSFYGVDLVWNPR
ncbi:hypothetical protein [Clostridium senegalense]|uniref:hypothetical protein n=1 Tax=Clostridium senegalense TaxID=1465809 RepID=UPI000288D24F|nr:hypothetical protein [Clostridium senegalense]